MPDHRQVEDLVYNAAEIGKLSPADKVNATADEVHDCVSLVAECQKECLQ